MARITTPMETPQRWCHRTWLVVTALVVLPIIGIPLTWTARWSTLGKVTGSVLGSLWLLLLISSTTAETSQHERLETGHAPVGTLQVG